MKKKIEKIKQELNKSGYCIVKNILNPKICIDYISSLKKISKKLNLNPNHKDELSKYGQVVIRDLVLREPKTFLKLIDTILIAQVLEKIFKDKFILDNCMASNSIQTEKNYKALVHIDSHLPSSEIKNTSDAVVLFCLDNFTKENGTTKIWPGSHLTGVRIQNEKKHLIRKKKFKFVEAPRGSAVFFLGQTWHQIGKNENNLSRWGVLCHYKRWWIKPSTDFTKCGTKIFKMLNNKQKELFGFSSISPKFNFKKKIRQLKTLRIISNIEKDYLKLLSY
jgi:ectoine hydroxylase-related dioxygenase (phytanoyl-CoA dioxygenase family)